EHVILRGLAKEREERYVDAAQFLEALDATPEGEEASRPKLSISRTGPARGVPALTIEKLVERASEERTTYRRPARKRGGGGAAIILLIGGLAAGGILARNYVGAREPEDKKSDLPAVGDEAPKRVEPSKPPPVEPKPNKVVENTIDGPSEPPKLMEPRAQA